MWNVPCTGPGHMRKSGLRYATTGTAPYVMAAMAFAVLNDCKYGISMEDGALS